MYVNYNANPQQKQVGDCVIRAISTVLNQDWETTYIGLAIQGFMMSDMPSSDSVWNEYLKSKGLARYIVPRYLPELLYGQAICRRTPNRYICRVCRSARCRGRRR